jgi:hypothetical protein
MIIAIITTITILIYGGSGFSFGGFKDAAEEVIKDKNRVKQIIIITEEADKELKALNENIDSSSKELTKMNRNYDLTRQEVENFFELDDIRHKAKKLMSQEEWEAMYAKIYNRK